MARAGGSRLILKLIVLVLLLAVLDVIFEVNFTKLNEVTVYTDRLQKGRQLRILQISDLHGKYRLNKRLLALAASAKPDIIVITGDLIDVSTTDFDGAYKLIEGLKEINEAIYFVPGNHEWRNGRLPELTEGLKAMGVTVMQNSNAVIQIGGTEVNLSGVDDVYTSHDDIENAMKGIDEANYTILLSHSPRVIDRLKNYEPDLVLSGHTHGGQVRLPFIGAVVAPGEGFFPRLDKGVFKLDEGKYLYLDSGAGTSILPIRFLDRSQISLIKVSG